MKMHSLYRLALNVVARHGTRRGDAETTVRTNVSPGLLRGVAPRNGARSGIQLAAVLLLFILDGSARTAQAQLACSLNLTPVVFDTIDTLSSGTYDARGSLIVKLYRIEWSGHRRLRGFCHRKRQRRGPDSPLWPGERTRAPRPDISGRRSEDALGKPGARSGRHADAHGGRPDERTGLCPALCSREGCGSRNLFGANPGHVALWRHGGSGG